MDHVHIRPARLEDGPRLREIDLATWTTRISPAPAPPSADAGEFFGDRTRVDDVLVAEVDGATVGYVKLALATPLESSAHVRTIHGLAVDPDVQGRGVGRALLEAAKAEVVRRGADRLTLRVLGGNATARRLYARAGFRVEGVFRGEFILDGSPVDDLSLAWRPEGVVGDDGRTYDADAEADVPEGVEDPLPLLEAWFDAAEVAGERQPSATVLSTVGAEGRPSSRAVLVRGFRDGGLVFHTNRRSRKAQEFAANPYAAMCSVWNSLHRQLRVEGRVIPASDAVSDAYWEGRPPGSRASAAASPQSQVVPDRAWLEAEVARVAAAHPDGPPRPEHWGGHVLVADVVEFWAGRRDRLHDRTRFARRPDGGWDRERLAP